MSKEKAIAHINNASKMISLKSIVRITNLSQIGCTIVRNGKMVIFLLKKLNRKNKYRMKNETFDFSEALRRIKDGKKVRRVIWEECGAYIHIVSETIVAVCDGKFFPCVFKDSEDILATDWEEVKG